MKKKFLSLLLMLSFLLAMIPTASANDIKVEINGNAIEFDQPPIIENGRTLVPLRAIFEALGAGVTWNDSIRTATAVKDDYTVSITVGSTNMYKDDTAIALDVPAKIVNGRTLVPARAIAESFGCEVNWDGTNKTVEITAFTEELAWENLKNFLIKNGNYSGDNDGYFLEKRLYKNIDLIIQYVPSNNDIITLGLKYRSDDDNVLNYCVMFSNSPELENKLGVSMTLNDDPPIVDYAFKDQIIRNNGSAKTLDVLMYNFYDDFYIKNGLYANTNTLPIISDIITYSHLLWKGNGLDLNPSKLGLTNFEQASFPRIKIYSPLEESKNVYASQMNAYLDNGWYEVPVTTVYARDGRTQIVPNSDIITWAKVGWLANNYITMYSPDGRTANVNLSDVESYKSVGWYENPISLQEVAFDTLKNIIINNSSNPKYPAIDYLIDDTSEFHATYHSTDNKIVIEFIDTSHKLVPSISSIEFNKYSSIVNYELLFDCSDMFFDNERHLQLGAKGSVERSSITKNTILTPSKYGSYFSYSDIIEPVSLGTKLCLFTLEYYLTNNGYSLRIADLGFTNLSY